MAFLLAWGAFPPSVLAGEPHVRVEAARDGGVLVVALRLTLPQGVHAYAHEPGEAGRPTQVAFAVEGGPPVPALYPAGTMQRDFFDASATIYVYEGEVTLFVAVPGEAAGKPYAGDVRLLLCSATRCQPVQKRFSGVLPVAPPPIDEMPWRAQWQSLRATAPDGAAASPQGSAPPAAPPLDAGAEGVVLPPPETFPFHLAPRFAQDSLEVSSLGKALALGILAGFLLNFMPCVLPVLSFKISGLLLMGRGRDGLRRFRRHNLFFSAGVMTLFTLLACILGLAGLMWGQLYQSQAVLMGMLLLVFLMGLSALGVFSLPVLDLKLGAGARHPALQAYCTGLLSTFLATPCSGPLLGGVLGWAFTQPLPILMAVFWAVGLGMALPYLLLTAWPGLAQLLPRGGGWMRAFERCMGFLLLGTALYLFSLLPAERHLPVLSAMLLLAFCVWLWGRYGAVAASARRRRWVGAVCLGLLLSACFWLVRPQSPAPAWSAFSPDAFAAALGKKPLLLEFTADWCPNCKFLEASVLTDARLRRWQARYGMDLVRVDLTGADAYAVRLLDALGSKSLPLTALFPAGASAERPLVLRDVYAPHMLEQALREAFGQ